MTLWIILILIPLLLGLYAQFKVSRTYSQQARIPSLGRITGREAAQAILNSAGVRGVSIVSIPGHLTDHYDPGTRRLALSEENYHGISLAALGVAAHEAGHAIQHRVGYSMMTLRQALVPVTQVSAGASHLLIVVGIVLGAQGLGGVFLTLGALALGVLCLFQLVTLPVEFDASRRAREHLLGLGIIGRGEVAGVRATLDAAALTYVAAFVASLGSLLHLLLVISGGRRE